MEKIRKLFRGKGPEKGQRVDPGNSRDRDHADESVPKAPKVMFPGPMLFLMEKKDVLACIKKKAQEILRHVEEPEQKEAYLFWQIIELLCDRNGKIMMSELAACLFKGYGCLRRKAPKLVCAKTQEDWCLPLARLLSSAMPEDECRQAVIEMADDLAERGQVFASHICCVVARVELGCHSDSSFDLIGCDSIPCKESAIMEAIERTEVYKYVLMTSNLQGGASGGTPDCYELFIKAIAHFNITPDVMEDILQKTERHIKGKAEVPEWLRKLRQFHAATVQPPGSPPFQVPSLNTTTEELESRYTVGKKLGEGGFGKVYAGVRKADGKKVAIKYVKKDKDDEYLTIPGQTERLPLEVALMQMVSVPPCCENIVELLEWCERSDCFVLVLERPTPCMDLDDFCNREQGRLSEAQARDIMRQVIKAVRHCCERGVLHRDIKPENLLINTETLQVKLIDFGCGDLLKDSLYTEFAGTPAYCPPECIQEGQYMGNPATVWSLGVLLFGLVCGDVPFQDEYQVIDGEIPQPDYLSEDCHDLICWCLIKDPEYRITLENITSHEWFEEEHQNNVQVHCGRDAGKLRICGTEDRNEMGLSWEEHPVVPPSKP